VFERAKTLLRLIEDTDKSQRVTWYKGIWQMEQYRNWFSVYASWTCCDLWGAVIDG